MSAFSNKKIIIFCLSYLEIEWTLQLIEENRSENCLVITYNNAVISLLTELYNKDIVYSTEHVIFPGIEKNPFKFIKNLYIFLIKKRDTLQLFTSLKNCKIYFFFVAFGLFESHLLLFLSKNNTIFYKPEVSLNSFVNDNNFIAIVNKYYIRFFLKIPVIPLKNKDKIFKAVSKEFLQAIHADVFELPNNHDEIKNLINDKFNIQSFKVLVLTGFIKSELTDKDQYLEKYNELIDFFIEKYGKASIAIKWHPSSNKDYCFNHELFEIPKYIPGNLIIDHFRVFCGHASALLFEAANRNKIAISTIDYCNVALNESGYKSYFEQNLNVGKEIIYFRDLDSLENKIISLEV